MKLYRIRDDKTRKFYRHKYSQFHGGDWTDADHATVWTKPGGVSGALGALREKAKASRRKDTFILETADIGEPNWSLPADQ